MYLEGFVEPPSQGRHGFAVGVVVGLVGRISHAKRTGRGDGTDLGPSGKYAIMTANKT
jgi:hypothetical protein